MDLRGIATRSQYGAQESIVDIKQRVAAFIEGADDSFHLPAVTIATGVGDEASEITADFTEMMLDARPDTDLATLAHTALTILGYRYPTDDADVDALLAGTPLPVDRALEDPKDSRSGDGSEKSNRRE